VEEDREEANAKESAVSVEPLRPLTWARVVRVGTVPLFLSPLWVLVSLLDGSRLHEQCVC
jgi:hypothetical protein